MAGYGQLERLSFKTKELLSFLILVSNEWTGVGIGKRHLRRIHCSANGAKQTASHVTSERGGVNVRYGGDFQREHNIGTPFQDFLKQGSDLPNRNIIDITKQQFWSLGPEVVYSLAIYWILLDDG